MTASHMEGVLRAMQDTLCEIEARGPRPLDGDRLVAFGEMLLEFAGDLLEAAHADGQEMDATEFDELMACIEATQDRITLLGAGEDRTTVAPSPAYPQSAAATT